MRIYRITTFGEGMVALALIFAMGALPRPSGCRYRCPEPLVRAMASRICLEHL